jgi:hypothetical protein
VNSAIPPGRILVRLSDNERDRSRRQSRSPNSSVRVRPLPSHQISVPSKQGLGLDGESSSASGQKKPGQSSEHCSIRWLQGRTRHLFAQDDNLVTKHDDFDSQVLLTSPRKADQLEEADKGGVQEGECHGPSSQLVSWLRNSRSTIRMTFSAPTGHCLLHETWRSGPRSHVSIKTLVPIATSQR